MNERLQELWDLSRNPSGRGHDEQKFAELIVQECVSLVYDGPISILEHFGFDNKQRDIARKRNELEEEIKKVNTQIEILRAECTHPNVIVKHGGNTGNYDPSQDCYWTDYHCPDCGFRWSVEH
jgi:hypothetical protein